VQSFDRALCGVSVELYAEFRQSSMRSLGGAPYRALRELRRASLAELLAEPLVELRAEPLVKLW